jgi:hypothetical protein
MGKIRSNIDESNSIIFLGYMMKVSIEGVNPRRPVHVIASAADTTNSVSVLSESSSRASGRAGMRDFHRIRYMGHKDASPTLRPSRMLPDSATSPIRIPNLRQCNPAIPPTLPPLLHPQHHRNIHSLRCSHVSSPKLSTGQTCPHSRLKQFYLNLKSLELTVSLLCTLSPRPHSQIHTTM